MVSLVQESTVVDTTGLSDFFAVPDDYLSLPNAQIQRIEPNVVSYAFTHIENLNYPSTVYDYDTFAVRLEEGVTYRMELAFNDPSMVQGNKIAYLMDIGIPSFIYKDLILSHSVNEPYTDGNKIYSLTFTAERDADHLISLETGTSAALMVPPNPSSSDEIFSLFPQSYAEPYAITVYDISQHKPDLTGSALVSQEHAESVALLYEAALNRVPDMAGLNYWLDLASQGMGNFEIAGYFLDSSEFQTRFNVQDDAAFIDRLYLNVLDRHADQSGKDYWLAQFEQGMGREEMLHYFAVSEENIDNAFWLAGLTPTDIGWVA